MTNLQKYNETVFESIKHLDEFGVEYWYARELMEKLEYKQWRRFNEVIERAIITCENCGYNVLDHFANVGKMVRTGDSMRKIDDYKLSRYACYLIAQNGDTRKKVIALAQTYFAVQTRKMELMEKDYNEMSEDEKRFYQRDLTKKGNYNLNQTAARAGVKNFAKFHNYGYKGLYNGETADAIAKRKGLRYREDILDNMSSVELATNLFRIEQTNEKLIRDNIKCEDNANNTHYEVGKKVRRAIADIGGTMPENLPTPSKSLKELENKNN